MLLIYVVRDLKGGGELLTRLADGKLKKKISFKNIWNLMGAQKFLLLLLLVFSASIFELNNIEANYLFSY